MAELPAVSDGEGIAAGTRLPEARPSWVKTSPNPVAVWRRGLDRRDWSGRLRLGYENPPAQEDGLPAKMNGGVKDHGYNAAKLRRQDVGGHATEAIATAPKTFVLLVLVLTRLPGVIMMIVIMRGWLLGRGRMEPSMRIAADERQRE
jgi:hypothetical protein